MREPDYARLLRFRTGLRRFVRWSDEQAAAAGVTPAQHQLLLAIRGSDAPRGPTISAVADALLLQHHSAVGLVDRAVDAGLVQRVPDPDDRRVVHLRPTARGARVLRHLSAAHEEELRRIAPNLEALFGPR
jgi:DNA-binding MarR family transcriptional regulator